MTWSDNGAFSEFIEILAVWLVEKVQWFRGFSMENGRDVLGEKVMNHFNVSLRINAAVVLF